MFVHTHAPGLLISSVSLPLSRVSGSEYAAFY
jgi:hypothetical protein